MGNAAKWWADAIRNTRHDAGDVMINMVATLTMDTQELTEEQLATFEKRLDAEIIANTRDGWCELGVDYHPCHVLAVAADAAGISHSRIPIKSWMVIDRKGIRAKLGYGGQWEELTNG